MTFRLLCLALVLAVLAVRAPATAATTAEPRTVSVSGRVVVPEGVDPSTVTLEAYRWQPDLKLLARQATTSANADGSYSFSGLRAGDHKFLVRQPGGVLASNLYYPRTGGGSSFVALTDGETRAGLDFVVPLGANLTGKVTVPAGVDRAGLLVGVHMVGASGRTTAPKGATFEAFLGGGDLKTARDVVVAPGGSATGLDLTLRRSGGITGRVEWDPALNLAPRHCVRVRAFTQGPNGPVAVGTEGRIAADGTYAVRGLATGEHRLRFAQAADCEHRLVPVATQFHPDALEFTYAADIAVKEGEDVALTSPTRLTQASRVTGLIETSNGTRRGGVSVELYRRTGGGRWQAAAGTTTDDVGAYEWVGIPAGEYRVGYARGSRRFIPRFYADSPTVAGARTVVLPPRDANQAIVLLRRVELYEIGSEISSRRAPRITGKPVVGSRMRVVAGTWQEKGVTVRRQWQVFRSHKPGAKWRSVPGATRMVFTPRKKHLGHYVRIRVTATSPGYRRAQVYGVTRKPVRRR